MSVDASVVFKSLEKTIAEYPANMDSSDLNQWYGPPLTQSMIDQAERKLKVKLPAAYLDLLRQQNGGFTPIEWLEHPNAPEEFQCRDLPGLGYSQGMDAEMGARYMVEEWGYPAGLLYLTGDGHTGICLDYRASGPLGEPAIVWVDAEMDPDTVHTLFDTCDEFLAFLESECIRQAETDPE